MGLVIVDAVMGVEGQMQPIPLEAPMEGLLITGVAIHTKHIHTKPITDKSFQ